MAEAHSAVAFSFSITSDGLDLNVNRDVFNLIFQSGLIAWKKRLGRLKNSCRTVIYPVTPFGLVTLIVTFAAIKFVGWAPPLINFDPCLKYWRGMFNPADQLLECLLYGIMVCALLTFLLRFTLKSLFCYQQWIYETRKVPSGKTKFWMIFIKVFKLISHKPLLTSFQGLLPKLSVPSVEHTMKRYLRSVKPLLDEENYKRMEGLAMEFQNGIAKKLQFNLKLKSWWATNYVSDWWEEYVYLRGRSPIMVNSNFYGVDAVLLDHSDIQVARAANLIYGIVLYRRQLERQELNPILLNKTIPLCSAQYERQFNTTRIPGIEKDTLVHYKDSDHVAVYHKGRFFKIYIRYGGRLLQPCELEVMLQKVVNDPTPPSKGETHLAALTAGNRVPWAKARAEFFSKGKNKNSLDAIEKAAFFVTLDDESHTYDMNNPSKLNEFGHSMLHGKGYDRWFDKSFTLIVCANGMVGFNAEHSWADAPVSGHLWEYSLSEDVLSLRYTEDGHTRGTVTETPPNPIKLEWEIPEACEEVIATSLGVAEALLNDVDLYILSHTAYGKGFMKKCNLSPDGYIQIALQLAYFRDAGKLSLTYESSMTRLFREGRTETVRSCTVESKEFVNAMNDKNKTKKECIELMRTAAAVHQQLYREAMTGCGIDRHLFCLYVLSKYFQLDSPFLNEVLNEPWRLSTSQTPYQQTDKLDLNKCPEYISAGGGFGPVADDGYGVSYIIAGEDVVFFHISSKKSCKLTDSERFSKNITQSLKEIRALFSED